MARWRQIILLKTESSCRAQPISHYSFLKCCNWTSWTQIFFTAFFNVWKNVPGIWFRSRYSGYHNFTTSFSKAWIQVLNRFNSSWWRSQPYRNQSIDLLWFLYDKDFRNERVKSCLRHVECLRWWEPLTMV